MHITPRRRIVKTAISRQPSRSNPVQANRRNILFVTPNLSRNDASVMLHSLVKDMQREGYDVQVISPVYGDLFEDYRVNNIPVVIQSQIGTFDNAAAETLLRCDILLINTIWYWKAVILGRSMGKRVIWNVHELKSVVDKVWLEEGVGQAFIRAHLVLFPPSGGRLTYWDNIGGGYFRTVYCGIEGRLLQAPQRRLLVVRNSDSVEPRNAQDILIKACHVLRPAIRNRFIFQFVGKVPDIDYLRYCQGKVGQLKNFSWPGHSPQQKIRDDYDMLVSASRVRVMQDVVLQAMSTGKTVISTPVGRIAEVVRDGVNGMLFNIDDYQQLSSHLEALYRDYSFRKGLGREAVETVHRLFGPAKFRECMLEIVSSVASRP